MLKKLVLAAIALLTFAGFAQAGDITFTGEVTYHERIALPEGAKLYVGLLALPQNKVVASATARIASPPRVPLNFTLNVRPTAVRSGGSYALRAEIRSGSRILFRSTQPIPVDISTPSPTAILVRFSPGAAPEPLSTTPAPAQPANPLLDTAWTVTSIGGTPVLPETEVTLSIASDRRAGGHSGCNDYFTEASFGPMDLSFGPIAGTKMACAPDVLNQETALFAALSATADFEIGGQSLKLLDAAGVPLVGLVQSP